MEAIIWNRDDMYYQLNNKKKQKTTHLDIINFEYCRLFAKQWVT